MTEPSSAVEPAATPALGPWHEVRSGVYVAVAEPESVNLGLIVEVAAYAAGRHRVESEQGCKIRAALAGVTDLPLTAVVVTHWHYDHAFGLAAFGDVPRIAHESVHVDSAPPKPQPTQGG